MEKAFLTASKNPLFRGIDFQDFESMMACLGARKKVFKKKELVYMSGDAITEIGLIIEGGVKISREDIKGNADIIAKLGPGEMFGEAFTCAGIKNIPVDVETTKDTTVMLIHYQKIITTCSHNCNFHNKLIDNMLRILAQKNIILNSKLDIFSRRSIREKVIRFLELNGKGEKNFTINYNREEMAEYLCVDRSALSYELSKMKKEGLIDYERNRFLIK